MTQHSCCQVYPQYNLSIRSPKDVHKEYSSEKDLAVPLGERPQCLGIAGWVSQLWDVPAREYYFAMRMTELQHATHE